MTGQPPMPEAITETMLAVVFADLTPCECAVLLWIVRGKRDEEIAVIRDISRATASTHVRNILHKLGVENRQDAAMQVVREIICRPDRWEV